MKLKTVRIELSPSEVRELLEIVLDDNRDEALRFMQKNLAKKVEKALADR